MGRKVIFTSNIKLREFKWFSESQGWLMIGLGLDFMAPDAGQAPAYVFCMVFPTVCYNMGTLSCHIPEWCQKESTTSYREKLLFSDQLKAVFYSGTSRIGCKHPKEWTRWCISVQGGKLLRKNLLILHHSSNFYFCMFLRNMKKLAQNINLSSTRILHNKSPIC